MGLRTHIHNMPDFRQAAAATYVAGFALSVALSVGSFVFVWAYLASPGVVYSRGFLIALLAIFAVAQMVVQVMFFLHLSASRRMRMSLVATMFTVFVVLCLVIGSIWIMQNLYYNMMPEHQTEYMQTKEGIHR